MTDNEIINEAVSQLKDYQRKCAEEAARREAEALRKQKIIDEVQRQTGADRNEAARFVGIAMNNLAIKIAESAYTPAPRPRRDAGEFDGVFH